MKKSTLEKAIILYRTQAGLARELGISRQFVSKMVERGVVPKSRQKQLEQLVKKALKALSDD